MSLVHVFTLLGIAVFAVSGALAAGRHSLDLIGVIVLAIVTATGGGTLRDVLLDRHPIFWIVDPSMILVSILAALVTWIWVKRFPVPGRSLLYADALGLAFFSIAGTQIAEAAGMSPVIAAIMGALTGCAGGVIRDALLAEIPLIFRQSELYVTACLAGIIVYIGLKGMVAPEIASSIGIVVILIARIAAIRWRITLPVMRLPGDKT